MKFIFCTLIIAAALFLGMLVFLELGRRAGIRQMAKDPEGTLRGLGPIEGAVFGLLGLLLAFSFSQAANRFDTRRHLVIDEANAIGTAYLRVDLLPQDKQPAVREAFRRYLDARLDIYHRLPDIEAAREAVAASEQRQQELWNLAVPAAKEGGYYPAAMLLVPAMNEMIDIAAMRIAVTHIHPPLVIYAMLFIVALGSAMLAGYGMSAEKARSWLHLVGFAGAIALCTYVIIDLEFPRLGLIQIRDFDKILVELRASMN